MIQDAAKKIRSVACMKNAKPKDASVIRCIESMCLQSPKLCVVL